MATTMGGVTVAQPGIPRINNITPRVEKRTASGSLIVQSASTTKLEWGLEWASITSSELSTIRGYIDGVDSFSFSPPDSASSYTVKRVGSVNWEPVSKVSDTYKLACTLQQV